MKYIRINLLKIKSWIFEWFKNLKLVFTNLWLMLFKHLWEIMKLYSYLFVFLYFVYFVLKMHVMFSYMLIIIILILIDYDTRITGWRYFAFVFIVLIHVLILKEGWHNTEILMISDLFWYSLLMLGAFIWHVLILNWLYKLCEKIGWDYGCYVVSRWSLLTSLTGVLWVLQWIQMILDYYVDDYIRLGCSWERGVDPWTGELFKESLICHKGDFYKFLEVIMLVFIVIIEYFCITFQNYSKLLLGLNEKINWREVPKLFYIYFILTFMLSWVLMTPRIYIIWVILLVWNINFIIKGLIKYLWRCCTDIDIRKWYLNNRYTFICLLLDNLSSMLRGKRKNFRFIIMDVSDWNLHGFEDLVDDWTNNWKLLYDSGLTRDYYWYSRLPKWHDAQYMHGVYEVLYIFEYLPDRYKKLIFRMFMSYGLYSDHCDISIEENFDHFKEDFLINDEWFTLENILGDYYVEDLPNEIVKKWINSYSWVLYRKEWHKEGFMILFTKKKIIKIWGRI